MLHGSIEDPTRDLRFHDRESGRDPRDSGLGLVISTFGGQGRGQPNLNLGHPYDALCSAMSGGTTRSTGNSLVRARTGNLLPDRNTDRRQVRDLVPCESEG